MQPTDMGDLETASTVSSRYLVELSALTFSGHDAVGSEIKAFAEQLKPYPSPLLSLSLSSLSSLSLLTLYHLICELSMSLHLRYVSLHSTGTQESNYVIHVYHSIPTYMVGVVGVVQPLVVTRHWPQ